MIDRTPCVYILTSNNNAVLYIGVTSQLPQRIWQHKNGVVEGFTKKYNVISSFTLSYSKIWQLP
ncbi:GIY-YIG nuclease family protein [Vibrio diabolicus]|uniref:GIY-YIG nuclease family protein n=1 Tax=Vibrio diabolicus TaxID=50719 RepID=UPI002852EDCF|nr:GIY-YIG nuclease family protein [Vibrio diabolicus]